MINQNFYLKAHSVRNVNELIKPRLFDLKQFRLPTRSVLHYMTLDSTETGPASDYTLFTGIEKPIFIKNVTDLASNQGAPREQPINLAELIQDYKNANRRMRILTADVSSVVDPNTLTVINYCILNRRYRYIRNLFTDYNKWQNLCATLVSTFNATSDNPQMAHFLPMQIPEIIPSVNELERAVKTVDQITLEHFRSQASLFLLELWKWLDPKTQSSSSLDKIPLSKLHLFNIIFIRRGLWFVFNLGELSSYRTVDTPSLDPKNVPVIVSRVKLQPLQLKKRLLAMMMYLDSASVGATSDTVDEAQIVIEQVSTSQAQVADDDDDGDAVALGNKVSITEQPKVDSSAIREQLLNIDDEDEPDIVQQKLALQDQEIDDDIAKLNEISLKRAQTEAQKSQLTVYDLLKQDEGELDQIIIARCDQLAEYNAITANEYKRFTKLASSYKSILAKDGKTPLSEFVKISKEDLEVKDEVNIPDSVGILDKHMLKSSLEVFDENYINKGIIDKDNAAAVLAIQKAGVIVSDYKVIKHESVLGAEEEHVIRLVPIEGVPSTIRFKVPVILPDGTFRTSGVKYRLRKQLNELPIRKIDYNRVALTSYYGKTFINRARRKSKDYGQWIQNQVMSAGLDKTNTIITDLITANVFDNTLQAPRAYSSLSMSFKSFNCRGYLVLLDHKEVAAVIDKTILQKFEKDSSVVFATRLDSTLVMDKHNSVYKINADNLEFVSTVEAFLGIDGSSAPVEYAEAVVAGKDIPVGVILAYYLGFDRLLKILGQKPTSVLAGKRVTIQPSEYALVFSDETLIFSREDKLASLIISGFNEYSKTIRAFNVHSFDKQAVYVNILEANKLSTRYIREMDLLNQLFIDPITKEILEDMKEPTTFIGLLVRACELLMDDQHPEEFDTKYMRIKGYERISGAIYRQLVGAVRLHNSQLGKAGKQIELNPYAVWKHITEDPTKVQVSEINPINALKETEAVTYSGTGGRSSRSMVKRTRAYHKSSMGTISESTVDSSDVGINIYLSANPQFTSLRGTSRTLDFEKTGAPSLLSTSATLAPCSDMDDPKRVNFIAIQQAHSIACEGYHQPTVRTGADQVIAHRSYDLFAVTAKQSGTVVSINKKGIIVKYKDGSTEGYELGRRFGSAAGLTIPHEVVSKLKAGEEFDIGDAICYNSGFFEEDFFDRKRVVLKNSLNVRTVLWESLETLEDASAISTSVAAKLMTDVTVVKTIIVSFSQTVTNLVKIGDSVEYDTVLCYIQDEVTAAGGFFTSDTIDTLKMLGAQSPRAHAKGVVEAVEVYYHGDKEDMSDSILALCEESDKRLRYIANSQGKKFYSGSVDAGFRIEGDGLTIDSVAIKVYITMKVPASIGD